MSPSRRSLRRMSSSLWRVALSTVTPPTSTGSSSAQGLRTPVRPTLMWILISRVCAVVGANLYATAQRGSRPAAPRVACSRRSSSFTTTPSMS